jgi:hypothetical protein
LGGPLGVVGPRTFYRPWREFSRLIP